MTVEHTIAVAFTWFMYLQVALLIGAIVYGNLYAILHAWRSGRTLWCGVLAALFLSAGGIATPFYLILFHDEPMPRAHARWGRALA
ncbi:MAG TPA: hypothetical protein VFZ75_12175 [Actinomycetota bacterium]|nr:hypothetical protein [Actinomycetota bacterium]